MQRKSLLKRTGRLLIIILAAIWMMFEDWVWDSILAVMEKIGRLPVIRHVEAFLAKQNRYFLLTLFCVPFLIMIPAKLYGLYLIADGKIIRGVTIFILAKGLITALVTRLFVVSKEKLIQIKTFSVSYYWFKEKKEWLYAQLNELSGWQAAKLKITKFKLRIKRIIRSVRREASD